MALDPDMKTLLDQMAAAKLQSFHQMTPTAAREQMKRRVSAGDPMPISRVEDRTIPGPNG
jgi:acetyl esterase